ncbi:MAG: phosphodiesterase [Microbacteriaceae bacterium]
MNTPRVAEYPRPDHFIVHLSDTHLGPDENLLYGSVDAHDHLRQLLDELEASGSRPEAIVFTGDLTDNGFPDAYARLRALVEPVASRIGAQVVWVMGNHDKRGAFRSELLHQQPSAAPVDRVYDINGLRIISLDSTVPGHHYGEISEAQLDWLAEELSSAAPHGTILAMHHPPVPSMLDLAVLVELRNQGALAEVVDGSDIRAIIAGHLHYSTHAMFAGIPVSVASATCYSQDLNVPSGGIRARDGAQSFDLIHVYHSTVLHSTVPLGRYPTVSYVNAVETAARLADAGVTIESSPSTPVTAEEPLTVPADPAHAATGALAGS